MGSGSSKAAKNKVKKPENDITAFSEPEDSPEEVRRRPKLESAKKLPKMNSNESSTNLTNVKRTIVGLIDSDDEEQEAPRTAKSRTSLGAAAPEADNKLRTEIRDLENTFAAIEVETASDKKFHRPRGDLTRSASIEQFEQLSQGSRTTLPPAAHRRASMTQGKAKSRQNAPNKQVTALKFSWQDEQVPPDKNSDEWTYKKVRFLYFCWTLL